MSSITLISLGFAIFAALFAFILYFKVQSDIADVKQQLAAIKNMQNRSVSPTSKVLTQSRTTETTTYSLIYNVEQQAIAWMLWLWQKTTGWLFSGNYIAKLGIFIFLIGIALLLSWPSFICEFFDAHAHGTTHSGALALTSLGVAGTSSWWACHGFMEGDSKRAL